MQSTAPVSQVQKEEAVGVGLVRRLTGLVIAPEETFREVNRDPNWLAPILITIVFAFAFSLFFSWWVQPDWNQIVREKVRERVENGSMAAPTAEQIERQVTLTKKIVGLLPFFSIISVPLFCFLLASVFALGLMLMMAQTTFKKILAVVAWSSCVPWCVATVVTVVTLLVRDRESIDPTQPTSVLASSLAVFLSSDTPATIRSVAASFDIFTIWFLILLTIGFASISEPPPLTKMQTGALVSGTWVAWVLIKAAGSTLGFGGA